MYGSKGKLLRVNLTKNEVTKEDLDEKIVKTFLGGRGLGAYVLYRELKPGVDPLGPENKLIFATGPVVGAPFAGNARYVVMGKSPLTGGWGEASAAGWFGPQLKFAGFDAIIVEGKAEKPVYLLVNDGEAEIRDANHLWGKIIGEVQDKIREEVNNDKLCVASIGPGGENLVRYACIISDLHRAAGRCGLGAIMGSKKLKSIAVHGTEGVKVHDSGKLRELAKIAVKEAMDGWGDGLHKNGTDRILEDLSGSGRLPTKNFQLTSFSGDQKITGETMTDKILVNRWHCYACPVGCIRIVKAEQPYIVDPAYGGPEYETAASFGSMCLNDNLVSIAKANELCNKFTIDTISAGVSIAFAMECYEKGLIDEDDVDVDLSWGNYETIVKLIEKIAFRNGIGDLLAEGVMRAAEKLGGDARKYAMHIKGMELPMHEPRGKKGVGLSYATSNRGACHLQTIHDDTYEKKKDLVPEIGLDTALSRYDTSESKARMVKIGQDLWGLYDCMIVCKFTPHPAGIKLKTLNGIFNAITDWSFSEKDLMAVGERAFNLCRVFNVREGVTRMDDTVPERFSEPVSETVSQGQTFTQKTLSKMLDYYYRCRGWDEKTGIPTRETLERLNLGWVAKDLK